MSRSMRPLSRRLLSLQCRRYQSTEASDKPVHSREQVQDLLHEQDDLYLAAVKRKVESIKRQSRNIGMIASKITNEGGYIQINPSIPTYKAAPWQKQSQAYESLVERMLKQTERILLNVGDLQTESYPSDFDIGGDRASVAALVKHDRDKMLRQTRPEQMDALVELRNHELAHRRRFKEGLDSFAKEVENYRLDTQKTPMPNLGMERKSLKENKPMQDNEGWGSPTKVTKIGSTPTLQKVSNPFDTSSSKDPARKSSDQNTARPSTADQENTRVSANTASTATNSSGMQTHPRPHRSKTRRTTRADRHRGLKMARQAKQRPQGPGRACWACNGSSRYQDSGDSSTKTRLDLCSPHSWQNRTSGRQRFRNAFVPSRMVNDYKPFSLVANLFLLPSRRPTTRVIRTTSVRTARPNIEMTRTHFYDLPNEVKLAILANLPAREIQRARRVSRHLRDLIDLEANRTLLINPLPPSVVSIKEACNFLIDFDVQNVDLLTLLARVVQHRRTGSHACSITARLWTHRHDIAGSHLRHHLAGLLDKFRRLHNEFHASSKDGDDGSAPPANLLRRLYDRLRRRLGGRTANRVGASPAGPSANFATMTAFNHYITSIHGAVLPSLNLSQNQIDDFYLRVVVHGVPSRDEETPHVGWVINLDSEPDALGLHHQICDLLGLPALPPPLLAPHSLQYAVKSRWACEKLRAYVNEGEREITEARLGNVIDRQLPVFTPSLFCTHNGKLTEGEKYQKPREQQQAEDLK
ncbi:uncharacterized protein MYCFIDRAFT_170423 [Pseudocercospora fijiensis CIRAD86]|uniref:F-box domain-containing protein n=1 Tax=Pseudocercospora fijiensis (strain CIRAD86) TaxID=383855 RepID=N1QC38_PSEFD|nr:uncharacterized protein MYCFIDRAFT_170423 [Pseudocercospora fijiensis CIRAD86]EME88853.1 hypothetical protein MYCFIDRAFT_170423 [Pseudocercospora fijiensis CIRAD86]